MATINLKNALESGKSADKKKIIVVGIVAVVLLVILLFFFVGRQQVAGKAIYTEMATPALAVTDDLSAGGTITVSVDVGSRTMTGATVHIFLPVDCSSVAVRDLFGGLLSGSENSYSCTGSNTASTLSFDDAILSGTRTGIVPLLELTFTNPSLPMLLQYTRFEIVDGNNRYTVPTLPASFTCRANSCTPGITVSEAVCDDGVITSPEVCEQDQSQGCTTATGGSGTQMCSSDCSMWGECVPLEVEARCGDGTVNGIEVCDGTNLGTATCASVLSNPAATGILSCTSGCTFDINGCEVTVDVENECTEAGTCPAVGDLFNGLTQDQRITLCAQYNIEATTCPGTSTFNADINGDTLIDDRDALFIFQAIEAKQSAYNYCGALDNPNTSADEKQPPCVFGDRAICEDVSYVWTASTSVTNAPALPTPATSTTLQTANILCGSLGGST